MKQVCFATGNFYTSRKRDVNKEIKAALKLDIEGIEITFGSAKELMNFKLNSANKNAMRKLESNTIHAPFYLSDKKRIFYWNTYFYRKLIEKLHKIYIETNSENINFHPQLIKNYKLLANKDYSYSIENMTPQWNLSLAYYKKILDTYSNINFLLDTSHARLTKQLRQLASNLKKRIKYVHLSSSMDGVDHLFLHEADKKSLNELSVVKDLNVPFIIETWYGEKEYFKFFRKEIDFVRKWLK